MYVIIYYYTMHLSTSLTFITYLPYTCVYTSYLLCDWGIVHGPLHKDLTKRGTYNHTLTLLKVLCLQGLEGIHIGGAIRS